MLPKTYSFECKMVSLSCSLWEADQLIVCVDYSSRNQMAFLPLPPKFFFLFLLEYGYVAIFKQKISRLYAYQLVSCVDSLIRVGVEKLAPVSKRASRWKTRFAQNVTIALCLLRQAHINWRGNTRFSF